MPIPLGESLRQWREYRHFSVAHLSRASGVEYNSIYRTEQGKHQSLRWPELYYVCVALGIDLDDLAQGCAKEVTHA